MTDHYGRHELEAQARQTLSDRRTKGTYNLDGLRRALANIDGKRAPIVAQVARSTGIAARRRKRGECILQWSQLGLEKRWRCYSKSRADQVQHKWEIEARGRTFVLKMNGYEVSRHRKVHWLMYRAKQTCEVLKHKPGRNGIL